jgi:hypothetical protein
MITNLGKLLVLLNAFAAVAVLSWAMSAYLNRQDSDLAVDANGEKLTDKVKRLNGELNVAQSVFGPEYAAVNEAELRLEDIRRKIAAHDAQTQSGVFFNIFDDNPTAVDPANPKALDNRRRILWLPLAADRQIKGVDGTPLKGVDAVQKELQDEGRKIADAITALKASVKASDALSVEITALNARTARLQRILLAFNDETVYLGDQQVNWDDRIATLRKRNTQLQTRLTELSAGNKAAAAPSPNSSAAVTLNPNTPR